MGQVFWNAAEELATVSTVFSVDGTATDPTAVSLTVKDPDGASTTYTYADTEITKDGTGEYHKDISCTSTTQGLWVAVWAGTGTASDVDVVTWNTFDTDLSKLYCTPQELKSRTGIAQDDKLDDLEIQAACSAVSRWIDQWCDRVFYRSAATRTFAASCGTELDTGDLVSITTLKTGTAGDGVFATTWSATDYQLLPYDVTYGEPRPYTCIRAAGGLRFPVAFGTGRVDRVQIDGVFGWPAVPAPVRQAAAILSNDYLKLGGMAFGVAGYGEWGPVRARSNPIATELLAPYRRHVVMVG